MARPYQKANIPGPEMGTSVKDPEVMANFLNSPKKKVFVIGSEALNWELDGKKVAEYFAEIANKIDCDVVATGHIYRFLNEHIKENEVYEMSLINITNRLSDEEWEGLNGEGRYSMAIFGGHLVFYSSQTLSRLKNFTNWVKTIELDRYSHPNARFSLPNLSEEEWKEFLEKLIEIL
jgi:anaerobic carbon-monoxide dehydrogenase, CODH/ACS complex subunit epsilon